VSDPVPQSPCVGCALCCNGTLYGRAKVAPGEEGRILEHGLKLTSFEDKPYFRLPCKYESCGQCTIYETRFEICRSFRCALLRSFDAGEITIEEARTKVAIALDLRAKIASADPEAVRFPERQELRQRLKAELAEGTAIDREKTAERLLNMAALDAFLEKWFRNKKLQDQPSDELLRADSNS